jgi:hypothetical protein
VANFEGFVALQSILHNLFTMMHDWLEPEEITPGEMRDASVLLVFESTGAQSLKDLRVSALCNGTKRPTLCTSRYTRYICRHTLSLILETSSFDASQTLTIRLTTPSGLNKAEAIHEHTIFHTLRTATVQALVPIVFGEKNAWKPEMWMNGLGQVVETKSTLCTEAKRGKDPTIVSDVHRELEGCVRIRKLHRKDTRYRGDQDRGGCEIWDASQLLPFEHSVSEMLKYILYVLDSDNPSRS